MGGKRTLLDVRQEGLEVGHQVPMALGDAPRGQHEDLFQAREAEEGNACV